MLERIPTLSRIVAEHLRRGAEQLWPGVGNDEERNVEYISASQCPFPNAKCWSVR